MCEQQLEKVELAVVALAQRVCQDMVMHSGDDEHDQLAQALEQSIAAGDVLAICKNLLSAWHMHSAICQ